MFGFFFGFFFVCFFFFREELFLVLIVGFCAEDFFLSVLYSRSGLCVWLETGNHVLT